MYITTNIIDSVMIVFISLFYTSILGINIGSMEQHAYLPVMNVIALLSPFATIYFIFYTLYSIGYALREDVVEIYSVL